MLVYLIPVSNRGGPFVYDFSLSIGDQIISFKLTCRANSTISHNAPLCNRNVHMRAHFCHKVVPCGIFVWCIVGFVRLLARSCEIYRVISSINPSCAGPMPNLVFTLMAIKFPRFLPGVFLLTLHRFLDISSAILNYVIHSKMEVLNHQ